MTKKQLSPFGVVVILFLVSIFLKLTITDRTFSLELLSKLFGGEASASFVFYHLRFPAILAAIVSSFLMVVATFILQAISKNELADPSALGFQNIAVTVLALSYLYFPAARYLSHAQILLIAAASVLLFSFAMYRFAMSDGKESEGNLLLLTGIGVNSFFQMILTYIKTYQNEANDLLAILLQGNFDSLSLSLAIGLSIVGAVILLVFFSQYGRLRLLQLDTDLSQSLGFNRHLSQMVLFTIMAFAVTTSLMFGSSYPFVAFTVIHSMRRYYSLYFGFHFLTASLLMAAIIMISDILAHQLFSFVVPTNLFLGLFSGLGFLILFLQRRSHQWS